MSLFKRGVITLDKALDAARFCLAVSDLPSLVEYNKGGVRMNEMMALLDNKGFALFELADQSCTSPEVLTEIDSVFILKYRNVQLEM